MTDKKILKKALMLFIFAVLMVLIYFGDKYIIDKYATSRELNMVFNEPYFSFLVGFFNFIIINALGVFLVYDVKIKEIFYSLPAALITSALSLQLTYTTYVNYKTVNDMPLRMEDFKPTITFSVFVYILMFLILNVIIGRLRDKS